MPERQRIQVINAEEVQGKDSWVKIKAMTVEQFNRKQAVSRGVQGLKPDAENYEARVTELDVESNALMAECVLEWNWVDDDGNPLPQPAGNPEVFKTLTMAELMFLAQYLDGTTSQKKERLKRSEKR